MRSPKNKNGLTVNVISGTHVVFFGLDLAEVKRPGFRGFAFKREDHAEGETYWLRGMKTFRKTEPHPARGETFSTRQHPVQSFQWSDYSVKPNRDYTYTVSALYGDPSALEVGAEIDVYIRTEAETGPTHSAFFNRGSVATQEYARRFQNEDPDTAGDGAYEWLSRGLLEAFIAFLDRAGQGWEVHGAIYEFQWEEALKAVKRAHDRGAKVHILFDDKGAGKPNRNAIKDVKIKSICQGRTNCKIMHNKFFVLSKNGQPTAVWTGSTNLTKNGIFGHSNLGHIVEDRAVAQAYLDYWKRLAEDPKVNNDYRAENIEATLVPQDPLPVGTCAVFSPRGTDLDALDWYADIAGKARDGLFMTFAFGMHEKFKDVYRKDDKVLRMALIEKESGSPSTVERDKKDIRAIRKRPNVVMAVGNRIVTNCFDSWLEEMSKIEKSVHVYWVHTKYMLVDPLSAAPTIVTGSANFSQASTDTNDENMLVIHGDKRIADIYFGEYMRLYTHYAYREAVKLYMEKKKGGSPELWTPQYLFDDDTWTKPYYDEKDTTGRYARRLYFGGPMAK